MAKAYDHPLVVLNRTVRHWRWRWRRTDHLAGLRARRLFEPTLRRMIKRDDIVLAVFDIDGMKWLMDYHGIPAGEAVLEQFAAVIVAEKPPRAAAFRSGGQEVALAFSGGDVAAATLVCERIRARFEASDVSVSYLPQPLSDFTLSVGINRYPRVKRPAYAVKTLLAGAYRSLGEAKAEGRNRVGRL
jgi:diguanylate cyclase (GGDEF)-like protein